jgi:hypothetical protein
MIDVVIAFGSYIVPNWACVFKAHATKTLAVFGVIFFGRFGFYIYRF